MSETEQAELLGRRLKLQTQAGEDVSGVVFGCTSDGVIVVQQEGSTPFHTNLRIIKQEYVEKVLECAREAEGPTEPLPPVDERRCREREERAVRAAELEAAKIGVGVTEEGQRVFDTLAKTLPCRWQGKTIVVLDEVFVREPYGSEDCSSLHPDDTATMDRVKMILESDRGSDRGGKI